MSTRTPVSLSGPYATYSDAEAERARLYRSGVLTATRLRSDGWHAERVHDAEAEAICAERAARRYRAAYVAQAA